MPSPTPPDRPDDLSCADQVVAEVRAALNAGVTETAVEASLAAAFATHAGLGPFTNATLAALTGADDPALTTRLTAAGVDLDGIVRAFEALVPAEEAKRHGAVFTPTAITAWMVAAAIDESNAHVRVIDPACGCAALLVAALRRIHTLTGRRPSTIVAEQLWGSDLSAQSITRARVLLALTCAALGDDVEQLPTNLTVTDSLTRDWTDERHRFGVVLANPPYVRFQQIDPDSRTELAARWAPLLDRGNWNLYFAFFALAQELCAPDGVIAYITPNNFFTAASAAPLRQWMTDNRWVSTFVDFGHNRVFEVLAYTTITLADRRSAPTGTLTYTPCTGLDELAGMPASGVTDRTSAVAYEKLGGAPWSLVGADVAAAVDAVASAPVRFGDVAQVRFGVATLRDRLYLVAGDLDGDGHLTKTFDGVRYPIEVAATIPAVKVSDIADDAGLHTSTQRIIYPYDITDGRAQVWSEERLRLDFPLCAAYFDAIRAELARRDKGNKTYAAWFAWGRTQGIVPLGDKLVSPLYAAAPRFLRDVSTHDVFCNGVAVTVTGSRWDLDALAQVLNSGVCRFFIEHTANAIDGGFYAYQKTQLGRMGLPDLDDVQLDELRALTEPGEIDDWLAAAYGMTLPDAYRRS